MGTRNIVAVYVDGEYKVAQYGQWDGYPEGQGIGCLHFLRDEMNESFANKVRKTKVVDSTYVHNLIRQYGETPSGGIKVDDYDRFSKDYPQFSRNTGSDILSIIQNGKDGMEIFADLDFVADGLFCEWVYVIDLDKGTFEAYEGFNQTPLDGGDRFCFLEYKARDGYHPARLVAEWRLKWLPGDDEFLEGFSGKE